MRAFRNELFSYSVAREGISPQNAKATLEQALIDLKEPMSNQKSLQEKFLKDKTTLQGFEKDFLGDKNVETSEYHKVLSIDIKYAIEYCREGFEKSKLLDFEGALADYSKAIQIDPNYADAYSERGIAKDELGDYRGAIEDFDKIIEMDPDDSCAYYNRGNAKQKLGDINGACLDWNKAVELGYKWANEMIKKYCK